MRIPRSWFRPGDIDGLVALGLENFIQVILIATLCRDMLNFPDWLIYGRILPGVAISMILGNVYYGWLTLREGKRQGRADMTALPFGLNSVTLFAYIFLVMSPIHTLAIAQGMSVDQAAEITWLSGLVACLGSGIFKLLALGSVRILQRYIPLASHLATLGIIAISFIAMGFFLRTFANPIISLVPLGIMLLTFLGQVKFAIPGGLLAILIGTALAWGTGSMQWDNTHLIAALQPIGFHPPGIWLGHLWQERQVLISYLSIIMPMSIFDFINSFQNLESAEAAGDSYPRTPALIVSGVTTVIAAVCGSFVPTTIYIGHPGFKAMGAGAGYSFLNGIFAAVLSFSGTAALLAYFIPIEAGMPIFIIISLFIVMQSFTAPPAHHIPAVVMGFLPGIAAWGALVAKGALRAAGMGTPTAPFSASLIERFQQNNFFIHGALALEQGYILTSIILASMTVWIIEKAFHKAAIWALIASLLSWIGLMHSYQWSTADTIGSLGWGNGGSWAVGYCLLAILFFYTYWRSKTISGSSVPLINSEQVEPVLISEVKGDHNDDYHSSPRPKL
ncbi:MAG: NCS2 family permease [Kovacikia sp.]